MRAMHDALKVLIASEPATQTFKQPLNMHQWPSTDGQMAHCMRHAAQRACDKRRQDTNTNALTSNQLHRN